MKNNILYGKKAQIFILVIVLAVFIVCGYALFQFWTATRGVESVLLAPSSMQKLYAGVDRFEWFTEQAAMLAVVQAYQDIAESDTFAAESCEIGDNYVQFCGLASGLDENFASGIKTNFQNFLVGYENDEFGNKFSEISYDFKVTGDTIKASSEEKELHMPVQEGKFPYSARYSFKQEISFSLEELGLTDFSEIHAKFLSCKDKETTDEIEICIQGLKNFDVKVSKEGEKSLFDLTSKKNFFFESSGKGIYKQISVRFSS